jgi:FlaA1/EpsC-like NDP-sugar epimerase
MALDIEALSKLATGRTSSLFADDLAANSEALRERIEESRILVIGGAGSIGSATVREIVKFNPRSLHVIDQNENNLVELVRSLRGDSDGIRLNDFRLLPLDFGAPVMRRFLHENGTYDFILNFAALKHVRSEKDIYSLTQLIDTNLVKQLRFMRWLGELNFRGRYFCVSTDKAAEPINLMGASKRVMEKLIFSKRIVPGASWQVTSARFANVAFSNGSLLFGFRNRLALRQPIAVPQHTRRYFVSLPESGQICLLAAVLPPSHLILVPRLDINTDLHDLQSIGEAYLHASGFAARAYENETEAKKNIQEDIKRGAYPLVLTPRDTTGEKEFEKFIEEGEVAREIGFKTLQAIHQEDTHGEALEIVMKRFEDLVDGISSQITKRDIVEMMASVVPSFTHHETNRNLDERL